MQGAVTKAYTPSQSAKKKGANYEIKYVDGDVADNRLFPATYAYGDDAAYGSWALIKLLEPLESVVENGASKKCKVTAKSGRGGKKRRVAVQDAERGPDVEAPVVPERAVEAPRAGPILSRSRVVVIDSDSEDEVVGECLPPSPPPCVPQQQRIPCQARCRADCTCPWKNSCVSETCDFPGPCQHWCRKCHSGFHNLHRKVPGLDCDSHCGCTPCDSTCC